MLNRKIKMKWNQILDEICSKALAEVQDSVNSYEVVAAWSEETYWDGSLPAPDQWQQVVQERPFAVSCVGDGLVALEPFAWADVVVHNPELSGSQLRPRIEAFLAAQQRLGRRSETIRWEVEVRQIRVNSVSI